MTRTRFRSIALAFAALCAALPLAAQDTTQGVRIGLVYRAGVKPGVLIAPVGGPNADSVQLMLGRDLDYSDAVTVVYQDGNEVPTGALNYPMYARLGAAAVIQATVTAAGSLHIALHDVGATKVMNVRDFQLPLPALSPEWRLAVHGAADEVQRWITGQPGIAQSRIAFVRDSRLWLVDSDGANMRPVPGADASYSPAWHPTGRYIAYDQQGADGHHRIMMRDLVGGSVRSVGTRMTLNITPAFSPDGTTLVFSAGEDGQDLYAVDAFGEAAPHRLTIGRGKSDAQPTFSPDGRRIAFTSNRLGHPEVYITDADGSNVDLLTTTGVGDYRSTPDWSPDGRRVALQSQVNGVFQIVTINLGDRSVTALTSEGRNEDPSWAPDGRHIVFTSSRSGSKQLWVLDTETYRTRQLTRGTVARQASWSPRLNNAK
jgi:TolB protein